MVVLMVRLVMVIVEWVMS